MAMDDLLTADEIAVRDRVRTFVDTEVTPIIAPYWERAEFPMQLVPKLRALNIAGGSLRGYGCPGMSAVADGLIGGGTGARRWQRGSLLSACIPRWR